MNLILVTWLGAQGRILARLYRSSEEIPRRYLRPEWRSTVTTLIRPGSTMLLGDARRILEQDR